MTTTKPIAKTPQTRVERYVTNLSDPVRRAECQGLLEMFARVTDLPAAIWGTSKVGYGRYKYELEGGFKSEFMMTGFEPGKALKDVNLGALEELVKLGLASTTRNYQTSEL